MQITPSLETTVNPFKVPPPLRFSLLTKMKMAVVGVTLFPIRVCVLVVALLFATLVASISSIGLRAKQEQRPSRVRRLLLQPLRLCARLALWSCGYWRIKVYHHPGSRPGASRVLVAAPHFSLLDAFVMLYLEMPCTVSKAAVAKLPIFGPAAVALQTIFVDRKDPQSKHKCVAAIRERATNDVWPPLLVFPEGTITNGQALISFKPGAFLPGVPVQPVSLWYSEPIGRQTE